MPRTDVILIGAGPIGLELAVCLKHTGVDYIHLEAGALAQTVTWYPKQVRYFSSPQRIAIAGVPLVTHNDEKATREEYLAYLRAVTQQFDLRVRCYEPVQRVQRHPDADNTNAANTAGTRPARFTVHTPRDTYHADRIVLAIGDMHAPRTLDIPGENLPHVSHYFDEPHRYFRQKLLIVGGKNSAVETALRCHHAGAHVTLSYRGERFDPSAVKYWILPEIEALIAHGQIHYLPQTIPTKIEPHQTLLQSTLGNPPSAIPADFVLLLTGYIQDPTLFDQLGVTRSGENQTPTLDPDTMMTNMPHVYVAGTAAAGTQHRFKLFIENCHPHVTKITRALTGHTPPPGLVNTAAQTFGLAES